MGAGWSYIPESGFELYFRPEITPKHTEEPTFDPNFGFANPRKERVMIATEAEMISAQLPKEERDYCAHLTIKHLDCRREHWPWAYACEHEKHAVLNCKYEDFVIRMKEYERERRLRIREQKIKKMEVAA